MNFSEDSDGRFILTLGCRDATGIVARIAGWINDCGGWIVEAAYHSDPHTGWFFTRQAIRADSVNLDLAQLQARFTAEVLIHLGAEVDWRITDSRAPKKVVLLVSKEGHCLGDLLGRAYRGELSASIEAVIGNHAELEDFTSRLGVPFYHLPFGTSPDEKAQAFAQLKTMVDEYQPDAVVLARFMQILPAELTEHWAGKAINIHHSFLPSFIGARPYHQAYARGVKLIGATCHYVTSELDQGPIIEQDVVRIDHAASISDLVRQGRDIEKLVLARGLRWHLENRVLVHGGKTVVFD